MTADDPQRLIAGGEDAPRDLREALEVAREELPTEEQLARVAAGLGPLLGGGGGGGGSAGDPSAGATTAAAAAASGGSAAKVTLLVGLVIGAGAGTAVVWSSADRDEAPEADVAEAPTAPETSVEPTAEEPVDVVIGAPTEPAVQSQTEPPAPRTPRRQPDENEPAPDPPAETELLRDAQDALRTDPARALALVETHARHYPSGLLGQEREVVAIDALLRLGRRADAEARAGRFSTRWPRAAGNRRIQTLLAR